KNQPTAARQTINDWVDKGTEGKIKNILPEGAISEDTRLVLANAMYYYAQWGLPFSESETKGRDFFRLDGGSTKVATMHQSGQFGYGKFDQYQVVELPYQAEDFSMVIILPETDDFHGWESSFRAEDFDAAIQQLQPTQMSLYLPKFKFETRF